MVKTKRLRVQALLVAGVMLLMGMTVSSCGSTKTVTRSSSRYHHRTPSAETTIARNGAEIPDEPLVSSEQWRTLTIQLTASDNKALYKELKSWLGTPYRYAAAQKHSGTDGSGLVLMVYKTVYGITLERNTARMFERNCEEIGRHRLKEGDLVFFNNGPERISHVGIYLKDDMFVHASSSRGVMVSSLQQPYFDTHFQCAARVITK